MTSSYLFVRICLRDSTQISIYIFFPWDLESTPVRPYPKNLFSFSYSISSLPSHPLIPLSFSPPLFPLLPCLSIKGSIHIKAVQSHFLNESIIGSLLLQFSDSNLPTSISLTRHDEAPPLVPGVQPPWRQLLPYNQHLSAITAQMHEPLQAPLCFLLQDILFLSMLIQHWKALQTISTSWMAPSRAVATL